MSDQAVQQTTELLSLGYIYKPVSFSIHVSLTFPVHRNNVVLSYINLEQSFAREREIYMF